jgi:hypothetical protein
LDDVLNAALRLVAAIQFDFAKKDVSVELEEMETESKMPENKQAFTICQLLATKSLLRPLLIACMLQVVQQLSGINAVRLSAPSAVYRVLFIKHSLNACYLNLFFAVLKTSFHRV